MNYVVDAKRMKAIDEITVNEIKISALVLMEQAALQIVNKMKAIIHKSDRILVVCGAGNNGGDGIAAGRMLMLQGYRVAILFLVEEEKATEQTKRQLEIARNLGMAMEHKNKIHEYNIIIDAIFGIGITRNITGEYEEVINAMNRSSCLVLSVDIPSGISADSGKVMNVAVRADYTITFGYQKLGLLLYPGADYAGEITVADIGFPGCAAESVAPDTCYYQKDDLKRLPKRQDYSNKGTYGRVLIIAGNKEMSGAAFLSAKAAYKTGAGLVKVLTTTENRVILQTLLPEVLFASYDNMDRDESNEELLAIIEWASVIIIGPGLGQSERAFLLLTRVIQNATVPVIIDADAINMLAKMMDSKQCYATESRILYLQQFLKENTILTPHLKELSRLIGNSVSDITDNIIDTATQCSYNSKLIYAIKDARTIVTHQNKKYLNISGNQGMATGGCGDVLTGIIAALIAQGMEPFDASCLAVYIHGLAGDVAARERGTYSLMASDLVDSIEKVLLGSETII